MPKIPGGAMKTVVVWWRSFVVESEGAYQLLKEAAMTDDTENRRRLTKAALDEENEWREAHGLRRE